MTLFGDPSRGGFWASGSQEAPGSRALVFNLLDLLAANPPIFRVGTFQGLVVVG